MNVHEQGFVHSFVQTSRRERVLSFLDHPKKRRKFTDELAHHGQYFFSPECLRSIQPSQQNAASIHATLHSLGAPQICHLISEGNLDGKEMDLGEALKEVVGYGVGTVISCIPGRLGYFEGESRERYILQK